MPHSGQWRAGSRGSGKPSKAQQADNTWWLILLWERGYIVLVDELGMVACDGGGEKDKKDAGKDIRVCIVGQQVLLEQTDEDWVEIVCFCFVVGRG
jgi:hypothetical protein